MNLRARKGSDECLTPLKPLTRWCKSPSGLRDDISMAYEIVYHNWNELQTEKYLAGELIYQILHTCMCSRVIP